MILPRGSRIDDSTPGELSVIPAAQREEHPITYRGHTLILLAHSTPKSQAVLRLLLNAARPGTSTVASPSQLLRELWNLPANP